MLRITDIEMFEDIFNYHRQFNAPYFFLTDFDTWKNSFVNDVDGEGRGLFKNLFVKAVYDDEYLVGFIQYGKTAFGFDQNGEISFNVSYPVIRNLYFDQDRDDAGKLLLTAAEDYFGTKDKVYAFFHYFGMSCFARHGKLFEQHSHIETLLYRNEFETEHENVYYSSVIKGDDRSAINIISHPMTKGNQQYIDFVCSDEQVGGCELHFINDNVAYLRWIYVNEALVGKGVGTECMKALKWWLYQNGVLRLDTDTALSNSVARHFYEKNGFIREGITRSYYRL